MAPDYRLISHRTLKHVVLEIGRYKQISILDNWQHFKHNYALLLDQCHNLTSAKLRIIGVAFQIALTYINMLVGYVDMRSTPLLVDYELVNPKKILDSFVDEELSRNKHVNSIKCTFNIESKHDKHPITEVLEELAYSHFTHLDISVDEKASHYGNHYLYNQLATRSLQSLSIRNDFVELYDLCRILGANSIGLTSLTATILYHDILINQNNGLGLDDNQVRPLNALQTYYHHGRDEADEENQNDCYRSTMYEYEGPMYHPETMSRHIDHFSQVLANHKSLRHLHLINRCDNNHGDHLDEYMLALDGHFNQQLAKALRSVCNNKLERIHLEGIELSDIILQSLHSLTHLSVTDGSVHVHNIPALCTMIRTNKQLEYLSLYNNHRHLQSIPDHMLTTLLDSLNESNIKELDIRRNPALEEYLGPRVHSLILVKE
ncbi:hypothetical protein SAMD00019534_016700 [Acytostelium subglobosum LB1]|uniref:hypothetical protein n=1 Tax=Acytostelium subglobosum LB1 TaxID=1410327 RepID=UPI00064493A0|nr:hypothetical protein SAMD00019534_016700 [Acytostelium subglobosum LB1]GAM18495.1 hypothetical protein SAMD00019534_016700 [Acytostelium subglobosum LB1]|eukprot:XP_012757715.1 hypothetical protein SAMD00019534_016700 [Acytostelium subglobosum LB1]